MIIPLSSVIEAFAVLSFERMGVLARPPIRGISYRTKKVSEVYRVLVREITPRYGLPLTIGSDNRPSFVAEMTQKLPKGLKIQ